MAETKQKKEKSKLKSDVVSDLHDLQSVVKKAIDQGAKTLEDVHKEVAKLPLKYLEKLERIEKPAKNVKEIQERTIGNIYDLIRNINSKADDIAKDVLKRL